MNNLENIRLPLIKVRIVMQDQTSAGIEMDIDENGMRLLEALSDANVPTDFYYEVLS